MEIFLPRSDWVIGKHKELNTKDLVELPSPRNATEPGEFNRGDART